MFTMAKQFKILQPIAAWIIDRWRYGQGAIGEGLPFFWEHRHQESREWD
jgi:hypothetical protein